MANTCLTFEDATLYQGEIAERNREGEIISPSAPATPDMAEVSTLTDEDKVQMLRAALSRSEAEALRLVAPVGSLVRNSIKAFETYRPMILVLKAHFCKRGGSRSRILTWKQVCKEHFGISIRRMQQLLASHETPTKHIRSERPSRVPAKSIGEEPISATLKLPKAGDCDLLVRNFHQVFGTQMEAALAGLDLPTFESVMSRFLANIAGTYGGKLVGYGYRVDVRKA